LATLCAYTSPNCAFIRSQNAVNRTPTRVLAGWGRAETGNLSADVSFLGTREY